jgi:uncharacterized protein
VKVVVSGASGLIGAALVARLDAGGHETVRLVRSEPRRPTDVLWDPNTGTLDATALEGADAIVNFNGVSIGARRWTDRQKRQIVDSRVSSSRLLADAIARRGERWPVFVSASAVGYYGDRGDEILTEESSGADDFLAGVCRQWEAACQPAADAGARTVCLRSGVVLSRDGGLLPRLALPFRMGLGGRLGSGRQWMSWVTLDDAVSAIEHVLGDDGIVGPVNVVAPEPVTNATFTTTLGRVLHRPAVLPTPMPALRAVYGHELVQALMLASQRAVPARLEASGFTFAHGTIADGLTAALGR